MAKHVRRGFPKREKAAADLGTPETRLKRLMALGSQRPNWPAPNPADASTALGILLWQGFLHGEYEQAKRMHDAGVTFASWWVAVHPKTFVQGTLGQFQPGGNVAVDSDEAETNLKAASSFIGKDRQVLDAVINTAVYQRCDLRRMEKLRTGLCRLIEWQREQRRAA